MAKNTQRMTNMRPSLAFVLLSVCFASCATLETYSLEDSQATQNPSLECREFPLELGLVLDSANSLKSDQFETAKQFFMSLVDHLDIGPNKTRVSLIHYGKEIVRERGFHLDKFTEKDKLKSAIYRSKQSIGEFQATGKGVDFMQKHLLNPCVTRPGVTKISVVITDRKSHNPQLIKSVAAKARQTGINLIAIGVEGTPEIDIMELRALVGEDSTRVITVDTFGALQSKLHVVRDKICEILFLEANAPVVPPTKTSENTSTDSPQMTNAGSKACDRPHPTDVFFVLNQSALRPEDTGMASEIIRRTIALAETTPGFRCGLISDVCDAQAVHGTYNETESVSLFGQYRIHSLNFQSDGGTCESESKQRRVAVIFASGGHTDLVQVQKYVDIFVKQGVKVFVVDLNGEGVQLCRAEILTLSGGGDSLADKLLQKLC